MKEFFSKISFRTTGQTYTRSFLPPWHQMTSMRGYEESPAGRRPWTGRLATCIEDPVTRLRFLKAVAPPPGRPAFVQIPVSVRRHRCSGRAGRFDSRSPDFPPGGLRARTEHSAANRNRAITNHRCISLRGVNLRGVNLH